MGVEEFLKIDYKNYEPIRTNMFIHKLKVRLQKEPSFIMCFKRNLTYDFFSEIFGLFEKKENGFVTNTIIQVSGLSGTGKSIAVLSLAKLTCPIFKEEHIYFFDQNILDNLSSLPMQAFAIRDENPNRSIYGMGSNRMGNQIETVADSCRKFGLSLIFVEPRFTINNVAKWYLETIDFGSIDGERFVRMGVREPTTLMFIGCIFVPIVDEDDYDWVAYNERKDSFISGVMAGDFSGAKIDMKGEADKVISEIDEEIYRTKKEKMFYITEKYPNLTTSELKNIMIAIDIRQRETRLGVDAKGKEVKKKVVNKNQKNRPMKRTPLKEKHKGRPMKRTKQKSIS